MAKNITTEPMHIQAPAGVLSLNLIFAHRVNFTWLPADESRRALHLTTNIFKGDDALKVEAHSLDYRRDLAQKVRAIRIVLEQIRSSADEPAWSMDYMNVILSAIAQYHLSLTWTDETQANPFSENSTGSGFILTVQGLEKIEIYFPDEDCVHHPRPDQVFQFLTALVMLADLFEENDGVPQGKREIGAIEEAFTDLNDKWKDMPLVRTAPAKKIKPGKLGKPKVSLAFTPVEEEPTELDSRGRVLKTMEITNGRLRQLDGLIAKAELDGVIKLERKIRILTRTLETVALVRDLVRNLEHVTCTPSLRAKLEKHINDPGGSFFLLIALGYERDDADLMASRLEDGRFDFSREEGESGATYYARFLGHRSDLLHEDLFKAERDLTTRNRELSLL